MDHLIQFISHNLLLCFTLIFMCIIFISFEFWTRNIKKFTVPTIEAINLFNHKHGIFLDVRDGKKYNQFHIIGALHTMIENLKNSTKFLKQYKLVPIIIYCDTDVKSEKAFKILKQENFKKVYILQGGIKQWCKEKLPIDILK